MLKLVNMEENITLAPYTTYKIGGPADYFFIAKSKDQLVEAVLEARKNQIPYFVLGCGANILIGDKGFRGLVIKNESSSVSIDGTKVVAESGALISELIILTKEQGLSGFEHFAGIPSTVGGALWQNLHFLSPDRQSTLFIDSILVSAEVLTERGILEKVGKDFFKFGYDYSILHEKEIFVTEATFKLTKKYSIEIERQIEANLSWRNQKQPQLIDFPSCGSVFKKIENVGAGRLIDEAGLKGFRVGNAEVSLKHANYIINLGEAKASEVVSIINAVKEKVLEKTGHKLETEIKYIGEF